MGDGLHELQMPEPICGIYFLVHNGEIVYIGQSRNIAQRIWGHEGEKRKTWDRVFFLRVPDYDLDAIEGTLLRCLKPSGNARTVHGNVCVALGSRAHDADWRRFLMDRMGTDTSDVARSVCAKLGEASETIDESRRAG